MKPRRGPAPGEVRLIGGLWKRSKLAVLPGPGLRPTPDRVRETLFNWLGGDLTGWRCCDAFAGTGALGLEAASRGAATVLLVEREAVQARALEALCRRLAGAEARVSVRQGDGLQALREAPSGSFDLVLLDPPYDSALLSAALPMAARCLGAGGFIYAESSSWIDLSPPGCEPYRRLQAGQVHAHLFRRLVPQGDPV